MLMKNYLKTFFKTLLIFGFFVFQMESSAEPKKELVLWTSSESVAQGIQKIKTDFETKYKAHITVEVLNKDLTSLFKTAALAGKGPDLLFWAHDVSGELAQSGLIEPLDEVPVLTQNFLPVAVNAFKYKGRLYGYPVSVESTVLFYNTKLINQVPESFEKLIEVAQKIQKPSEGIYGFLFDFKNFFFSYPILNAGGGYVFKQTEDGFDSQDVGLNQKGFIQGLKLLSDLKKSKLIPGSTDRGIAFELFKKNKLAMMIDGPWAIKDLKAQKVPFQIAMIPKIQGQVPKPFVGIQGVMIRRSSSQKLLAKEFAEKYILEKEFAEFFSEQEQKISARKDVNLDLSKNNEHALILMKSVESGSAMPNIPKMSAVWGAMGKALTLTIDQDQPPEKALNRAVEEVKAL